MVEEKKEGASPRKGKPLPVSKATGGLRPGAKSSARESVTGKFSSACASRPAHAARALPMPGTRRWQSSGAANGSRLIVIMRAFLG